MAGTNCPLCGGESLEVMHGTFHFNPPPTIPGGAMIITNATWQHCSTCNEDILSHELDQAIDRERYHRLGLLTPEEIRKVREKTGKSAIHMSHALGVGEKTYTRWENGRSPQTKAMDTLIRLIDQNPEVFAILAAEREPGREEFVDDYFRDLERLKGDNELAMAAHGAEMSMDTWKAVRRCLMAIKHK